MFLLITHYAIKVPINQGINDAKNNLIFLNSKYRIRLIIKNKKGVINE